MKIPYLSMYVREQWMHFADLRTYLIIGLTKVEKLNKEHALLRSQVPIWINTSEMDQVQLSLGNETKDTLGLLFFASYI